MKRLVSIVLMLTSEPRHIFTFHPAQKTYDLVSPKKHGFFHFDRTLDN